MPNVDSAQARFLEVLARWEELPDAEKRIDGSAYAEMLIEIGQAFLEENADLMRQNRRLMDMGFERFDQSQ
jgi:hypothetical protein